MFQERFTHVSFSKLQIQEKEKELKRDYNLLKEAKKQSGVHVGDTTFGPGAEGLRRQGVNEHRSQHRERTKKMSVFAYPRSGRRGHAKTWRRKYRGED